MTITCEDQEEHRPEWVVLDLDWCRANSADLGWATPGHHTVACPVCFVAWRSNAKYVRDLPRKRNAQSQKIIELCREHPLLAELTYFTESDTLARRYSFLWKMGRQLAEHGTLSPRQIEASEHVIEQHMDKANAAAEQARQLAERGLASGVAVMTGEVVEAWMKPYDDRTVPRMVLRHRDIEVEATVPKPLFQQADRVEQLIGRRIELHATFFFPDDLSERGSAAYPRKRSQFVD